MRKSIRRVATMFLAIMLISCFMSLSASATYDVPITSVSQTSSVGWTLYIDGDEYQIPSEAVVTWGSSGRNVYVAQLACNTLYRDCPSMNCYCGDADGVYGENTNKGVKGFQSYCNTNGVRGYNELVDGKVGPVTWGRLSLFLSWKP